MKDLSVSVDEVIDKKIIDLNGVAYTQFTALHYAALHGKLDIVKLLLANDAGTCIHTPSVEYVGILTTGTVCDRIT